MNIYRFFINTQMIAILEVESMPNAYWTGRILSGKIPDKISRIAKAINDAANQQLLVEVDRLDKQLAEMTPVIEYNGVCTKITDFYMTDDVTIFFKLGAKLGTG